MVKVEGDTLSNPAVTLLAIYPGETSMYTQKDMYENVHKSVVCNSINVETNIQQLENGQIVA